MSKKIIVFGAWIVMAGSVILLPFTFLEQDNVDKEHGVIRIVLNIFVILAMGLLIISKKKETKKGIN